MRPLPRVESSPVVKHVRSRDRARAAPSPHQDKTVCRRSMQRILWHDSQLPVDVVEMLWTNPDAMISSGEMLKDGDRCTVVRIAGDPARNEKAMVLKRYNTKDSFHTVVHTMMRSRARWSWLSARRLLAAGLPTPQPLACIEDRRGGVLRMRSYLLTEFVLGVNLRDYIEHNKPEQTDLRDFAQQFVSLWQVLGQLRIGHGDMKATNFIVDPEKRIWLIDLDGLRVYRSRYLLHRERRNDLARFMKNWQDLPEVAAIFRARIGTG